MKTKKLLFIFSLLISSLFYLSNCIFDGSGGVQESLIIAPSEGDSNRERRTTTSRDSSTRGKCEDTGDCDEICEEIYNEGDDDENEGKIEECLKLKYSTVVELEKIYEILDEKEPDYTALNNIKIKHFSKFLQISVAPWVERVKDLNRDGSKIVLRWIAKNQNNNFAGEIIKAYEEYEDFDLYEGVERMIKDVASNQNTECKSICDGLADANIGSGRNFWDIANRVSNTKAKEIACDLVDSHCDTADKKNNCNAMSASLDLGTLCNQL